MDKGQTGFSETITAVLPVQNLDAPPERHGVYSTRLAVKGPL